MQTPEEVLVMRQQLERGWSRRRIAAELGMSRNTLDRYLRLDEWQPYSTLNRPGRLDEHWSYPDSVDSDQGLAVVSLRVLMNCCS
ncbi:MAG: hypothetical protein RLZZ268_707 [Cyanobacteriota bacterium]